MPPSPARRRGPRPGSVARVGRAVAPVLLLTLLLAPAVPAGPPASHYAFTLRGVVATPLWWSVGAVDLEEVQRYDVGPLLAGTSVRVHARETTPGAGVHLYAFARDGGRSLVPLPAQDPVPWPEKALTLAGPGTFSVLVDAGTSGPYRIELTFAGALGGPTGPPVPFPLIARGSYACPLAFASACPP